MNRRYDDVPPRSAKFNSEWDNSFKRTVTASLPATFVTCPRPSPMCAVVQPAHRAAEAIDAIHQTGRQLIMSGTSLLALLPPRRKLATPVPSFEHAQNSLKAA